MKKKRITQEDIARLCGIDQGSVSRILNKDTRDSFAKETIDRVFKAAREAGYLHPALVTSNRRSSVRKGIQVTAHLRILGSDGALHAEGSAEIDNISLSGMLLRSIKTATNTLPLDPHRFDLEVTSSRLKGFKARCRPVRFAEGEGGLAIAVRYEPLDDVNRQLLEAHLK
jgi:transcriptional regulator with XRE-family HTH domain